jgi:hypothetical protein
MSIESSVCVNYKEQLVVWRMSIEVAEFYAEQLERVQGNDAGIKEDAAELLGCATALREFQQ